MNVARKRCSLKCFLASASDDESESEEEEEDDDFGEIYKPIATKQLTTKSRRISVSAEALSPHDARKFERVVHNKSLEERNRISKIVAENLLFKSMDEKQHEIVLDAIFPKEFEPEDVIIRQGADGDNFYILESGVCEIYKDGVLVQTVSMLEMSECCERRHKSSVL